MVWFGCSDADQDKRGEVNGTVSLDGRPVAEGSITFLPTGGTSGPSAGAAIVAGKYHVERGKGPPLGDHRVEFYGIKRTGKMVGDRFGEGTMEQSTELFPPTFNIESKIVRKIEPGLNTIHFDLKTNEGNGE